MRSILNSKSKKAQDISVGTIIIIIIALVVLVFLVIAFTRGGGSLMDNIRNFFGGSSNVDTIKNACSAACSTSQTYEYNQVKRDVKLADGTRVLGVTCRDLESPREGRCSSGASIISGVPQDNCKGIWTNAVTGADGTVSPSGCTVNGISQEGFDKAKCDAVKWDPGYAKLVDSCANLRALDSA